MKKVIAIVIMSLALVACGDDDDDYVDPDYNTADYRSDTNYYITTVLGYDAREVECAIATVTQQVRLDLKVAVDIDCNWEGSYVGND
jgi:hypothetical protein